MKAQFTVTFEFIDGPPVTERGIVGAGGPRTLVARAIDAMVEKHPKRRWNSLVVVLDRDASLNLGDDSDTTEGPTVPA